MSARLETCWIDGRVVTGPEAALALDRGLAQGYALVETMGAHGGDLPLWDRHEERLRRSAARLGIPCEPRDDLRQLAVELLDRAARPNGVLRLCWTAESRCVLSTRDRVECPRPLHLRAASATRTAGDPTAAVKSTSRLFYELAQREVAATGADEALILGPGDTVLETATGNVFARIDDRLCTPIDNGAFLCGIARAVLLEQLAAVEQRAITAAELRRADALWVTNAVYGPRLATFDGSTEAELPERDPLVAAWRAALA